jgi:hypothetical protein
VQGAVTCPDRERRMSSSALDQSATLAQLKAMPAPADGLFFGTLRHAVGTTDGTLPPGVAGADCATFGSGTPACPTSAAQIVALYRLTSSALPLLQESQADALADAVAFHEPVVNTQSGTRYQAPIYGVSAVAIVPPRVATVPARFILRNSDCGVVVLLGDASKLDSPLAVEIPADGALLWRWPNEGVRLLARPDATDRTCLSGPLSGSLQCTNDNVCDGGVCAAPAARAGVPYPYAAAAYDCAARRITCPRRNEPCCSDEITRWYLYAARSSALVYQPRTQ